MRTRRHRLVIGLSVLWTLPAWSNDLAGAKLFVDKVRPILATRCVKCHGPEKQKSNFRLDSRDALIKGGEVGPGLTPGKPDESSIIEAINHAGLEMPPGGKLPAREIEILTEWVKVGAPWPTDVNVADFKPASRLTDEDRKFWSFLPVQDPAPPAPDDAQNWVRNDLDRFVLQKLRAEGLGPAKPADRRTLLRRAKIDLHGLPPTQAETQKFLNDSAPDAYEKLIDALLDSPLYGQRWGRHWLDVVRYAESDGYKQDDYRPTAWRFRDYVIDSLNQDKPWDRFIQEQLAGDELDPHNAEALIATGFMRLGQYEYNQRDVRNQWSIIMNEVTDVAGDAILGLGIGCARCHDHKFDPILQKDYFRIQAFFAPMLQTESVVATPTTKAEHDAKKAAWEEKTAEIRKQIAAFMDPRVEKTRPGAISKFPKEVQKMMFKEPAERTPYEHQLAELAFRQVVAEYDQLASKFKDDTKKQWDEFQAELGKFADLKPADLPKAMTIKDVSTTAPTTFIPEDSKKTPIPPGFLSVLDPADAQVIPPTETESTGRRLALARWVTDPYNPLTTRVAVNRLWQGHFGKGLVATSSDFGRLGEKPTHPELLDWLTTRFIQSGFRMKAMHRLIMTSATYQQSANNPLERQAIAKDPENRWLWKMMPRRMDAELVRDAMLLVSGEMDAAVGGPGGAVGGQRRSVYTKVLRNTPDPILASFDAPDGFSSCAQRMVTTTPTQALMMINGDWTLKRADAFAKRLLDATKDSTELVNRVYHESYSRPPRPDELKLAVDFLDRQKKLPSKNVDARVQTLTEKMPSGLTKAIVVRDGSSQDIVRVPADATMPAADFTIEAIVLLKSLYANASVRVIAAQWDGNQQNPGWSFGVTSTQSSHQPRNLILQMVGAEGYEVIPSGLRVELDKPMYLACSFKAEDTSTLGVTFVMRDLTKPEQPVYLAQVKHKVTKGFQTKTALTIGGIVNKGQGWDGLIDEVRLSTKPLAIEQLLIHAKTPATEVVGHWKFEDDKKVLADASGKKHDALAAPDTAKLDPLRIALADFCHVIMNSNEFLYVD